MGMTERPAPGIGCLGTFVGALILVGIVALVVFAGVVALAIAAAVLVIGLVVLAVDRVLLAVSPKRRERRAGQQRMFMWRAGPFPPGPVIDTTATDTTPTGDAPGLHEGTPDDGRQD